MVCFIAAAWQARKGLNALADLRVWQARVAALIAQGNDMSCGFISATTVRRVRIAFLGASLAMFAAAPLLTPSRRTLTWALAAAATCLAIFGTTYGLPPNPGFSPDAKTLLLACVIGLGSIVASPPTDSASVASRIVARVVLGTALAGLSALQLIPLPGSTPPSSGDNVAIIFFLAPTATALFASAIALRRSCRPDSLYRGLPLLVMAGLLGVALFLGRL